VISAYLSLSPPRGQRTAVLEQLAAKSWTLPDGRTVQFAAETLRVWVRRFRKGGLSALEDAPRRRPGVHVLDDDQQALVCRLKRDVPSRSVDRIIDIAEEMSLVPKGVLKRSTVHRVLQSRGLSKRKQGAASTADLDRFEAAFPNDLWQSDMLSGPWLPDPDRPGKQRRAWLHAWLDDHSRLLLAGRWAFKSDLPTLEMAFREALCRCGLPRRVYYDNGGPYRSKHMAQIVAVLSNQEPIFTPARRPEGHGKIEAFNRLCRAAFVDEVQASSITTLEELNRAFAAWRDLKYNRRPHEEIGEAPWDRWRAHLGRLRTVGERLLTEAFLFRATRTTDKAGVLQLHGVRYQVGPELARKRVEVRYDPERMETIEVWHGQTFQERVQPLQVAPQRRPRVPQPEVQPDPDGPLVDFLGHLVEHHDPIPDGDAVERARVERRQRDEAVVAAVRDLLDPQVFDEHEVRDFVGRYGPFEADTIEAHVRLIVEMGGTDQHIHSVLRQLRVAIGGAA
jgi:transposase InsO family protein